MKTVIIDTNMLMQIGQFKLDILSEIDRICLFCHKVAILEGTIIELEGIVHNQKGKDKACASLALQIASTLPRIKDKKQLVDDIITSRKKQYLVLL